MFPQTSPYLWYGIGVASLMAAWVVWSWPLAWISRIKFDFQGPRNISLGWIIAVLLLIFIVAKEPTTRWIQEQGKAIQFSYALIRTKPICGSTCKNLDWIIETCKRRAVEIGRLKNLSRSDAKRATRYFRGCLIDRGMNWQKCEKGEPGCMRFRYFGSRWGATELPSFVEELPDAQGEHDK